MLRSFRLPEFRDDASRTGMPVSAPGARRTETPGLRLKSLKSLGSRKQKILILLPKALILLPLDFDFSSNRFDNASIGPQKNLCFT
jgi:hypothetical protein